ncbi:MAG: hypothetical protein SVR08_18100, partial [Spirochaetota bacterium]|nr:hypothetical protein [Spirochaetota bacterium]
AIFSEMLSQKNIDIGVKLVNIDNFIKNSQLHESVKDDIYKLLDIILAKTLHQIVLNKKRSSHPQNLRNILWYFYGRRAELLLIIDSLLLIILDEEVFALEERGRASRVLLKNYRIESIFIYISEVRSFNHDQKEFIFSHLSAYQKVFRKIQEILFDKQKQKVYVAKIWFNKTLSELKENGEIPTLEYETYILINKLIESFIDGNDHEFENIGKSIVLVVENEEVIRIIYNTINKALYISKDYELRKELFSKIYLIMQDYRRICTSNESLSANISDKIIADTHQIIESETLISQSYDQDSKTPVLGKKRNHILLDETRQNLDESHLLHLFQIWPIPEISQNIFNSICRLKDMIPHEREYLVSHFLYREKILEFLMRIDRIGIRIIKDFSLPLLTNPVQLEMFNYIKKGAYFGSTGHWNSPNQKPPSVVCCINPHALGNCVGHALRHIFLRVFLATGEFYESPFVVDSTERLGSMDEDAEIDALLIRPGLFLLDIPEQIVEYWKEIQNIQLSDHLDGIIKNRIKREKMIEMTINRI